MKRPRPTAVLGLLVAVGVLAACAGTAPTPADESAPTSTVAPTAVANVDGALEVDGRARTYRVHIPAGLGPDPVPLVLALHGGMGSGEPFARNSGLDTVADANGFIVVYPDGIGGVAGNDDLKTWNAGYCCGPAQREQIDDVTFLSELIDELEATLPVDPARVFALGHSNGGMMAYRLACELAGRVVAVAVYGSSLGIPSCTPEQPVSLLHVHGTDDRNHPIDGGRGDKSFTTIDFAPAVDGVETLASASGCTGNQVEERGDLTTTTWFGCDSSAEVAFVAISGASHAWPGGAGGNERLVGPTYADYDASAEMWAFFSALPARDAG
jgi:polyhydroxybutyrate depolymerase